MDRIIKALSKVDILHNYMLQMNLQKLKDSHQRPNRTGFLPVRVRFGSASFSGIQFGFGSVRLHFQKICSGSVRFDCIFKESVRVRFGSTAFPKHQFGFGSVRLSSDSLHS